MVQEFASSAAGFRDLGLGLGLVRIGARDHEMHGVAFRDITGISHKKSQSSPKEVPTPQTSLGSSRGSFLVWRNSQGKSFRYFFCKASMCRVENNAALNRLRVVALNPVVISRRIPYNTPSIHSLISTSQ